MGDNKKTPITINDKDYNFEDLTEQQQMMVNHIADLDRKIRSTQFNLDQLTVGKDAFVNMLTASLAETETEEWKRLGPSRNLSATCLTMAWSWRTGASRLWMATTAHLHTARLALRLTRPTLRLSPMKI